MKGKRGRPRGSKNKITWGEFPKMGSHKVERKLNEEGEEFRFALTLLRTVVEILERVIRRK
jgi:hypothetical protein